MQPILFSIAVSMLTAAILLTPYVWYHSKGPAGRRDSERKREARLASARLDLWNRTQQPVDTEPSPPPQ